MMVQEKGKHLDLKEIQRQRYEKIVFSKIQKLTYTFFPSLPQGWPLEDLPIINDFVEVFFFGLQ